MIEVIAQAILEVVVIYPGILLRWLFLNKNKKTLREIKMDKTYESALLGIAFYFSVGLVSWMLVKQAQ